MRQKSGLYQILKNGILLANHFFPADLKAQTEAFIDCHNYQRYLEYERIPL